MSPGPLTGRSERSEHVLQLRNQRDEVALTDEQIAAWGVGAAMMPKELSIQPQMRAEYRAQFICFNKLLVAVGQPEVTWSEYKNEQPYRGAGSPDER